MGDLKEFTLPLYNEIPNVGLFLEQVTKYIDSYLSPVDSFNLTSSMISNYVKKDIIKNPVKKQYDREQIAYLIFIAIAKSELSLDNIQLLIGLKQKRTTTEEAYTYFRNELLGMIEAVDRGEDVKTIAYDPSDQESRAKTLLYYTVVTVAHKIYLYKYLSSLQQDLEGIK